VVLSVEQRAAAGRLSGLGRLSLCLRGRGHEGVSGALPRKHTREELNAAVRVLSGAYRIGNAERVCEPPASSTCRGRGSQTGGRSSLPKMTRVGRLQRPRRVAAVPRIRRQPQQHHRRTYRRQVPELQGCLQRLPHVHAEWLRPRCHSDGPVAVINDTSFSSKK
jgi:hypothetical protein